MSYGGTKAQSGNQTVLSIFGTGALASGVWTFTPIAASGTPTVIGEISDFTQSGTMMKTDDATNLQSTYEEFIPTIPTPGKFAGTVNRLSGDAGQMAIYAAFKQVPPVLATFKVQLPKNSTQTTAGDSYIFVALVEELNDLGNVKPDKIVKTPFSLKVSGTITETVGS